ncbi:hypothetical protein WH47_10538 [Habropoda laboriosa]|uniref:Uncharacterized protein n=1 Tax=Habropoda laboriosa TaxID=597456 RepID=A0A0L7QMP5_9HYME|nr:hypothetical protein WH47_10538 [Habropoda laboriosa]
MPTCANCGGQHTANYSQCPSLLGYLAKRNTVVSRNIGLSSYPARKAPIASSSSPPLPNHPYSQIVSGDTASSAPHTSKSAAPSQVTDFQELFKEFSSFAQKVIPVVKTYVPKLVACHTIFDKIEVIKT